MKHLWLALALLASSGSTLFSNGGAWQTGIPATGNASASKNNRHTDVVIEDETLKIDLHPEYADVTVRYRMHNTGPKVQQDFFFPVERWAANPDSDNDGSTKDISDYQIRVDGKDLKWSNVMGSKRKESAIKQQTSEAPEDADQPAEPKEAEENGDQTSGSIWQQEVSTIKSWKKSVIPFAQNQARDVTIHYKGRYAESDESVSDDVH